MKILILGAKGSLGQTFADLYHDEEVYGWDREELDITEEDNVMEKIVELKPDLVINCAAYNAVDRAEEDRLTADQINGYAVGNIAKAAEQVGAMVMHFSTNYVFDGNNPEGYNEEDIPNPQSAYAKSKFLGEMELAENTENFYLIRTSWLYGRSVAGKKSFVDLMLEKSKETKELNMVVDEYASPTYVIDLAHAARALVEEHKPFGTYHLVNSGSTNWLGWAQEIFKVKDIPMTLKEISGAEFKRPAIRPKYGILNNTKFIELRPWTEALKEYLNK